MQCRRQKLFYPSWLLISMHPIRHHVPWFKFQILWKDEIVFLFYACGLHVLCIVPIPTVGSMILVEAIMVVSGGMSISRRGFEAVINFTSYCWFYASNRPSRAMIQILNFEQDEMVPMFYAFGLHVLWIVPMLIIHTPYMLWFKF